MQRRFRGRSRHRAFRDLRLPSSDLHDERYRRRDRTVVRVVADFIEPSERAEWYSAIVTRSLAPSRAGYQRTRARLLRCQPGARCGRPFCARCSRIYRVWVASQALALARRNVPACTVVIILKEVGADRLALVDRARELDRLRKDLVRVGITVAIGHLEVAYKPGRHSWSVHAHLLIFGRVGPALDRLRRALKDRGIDRAISVAAINKPVRQITYLFKFATYYRYGESRRPYPLPRGQLEQLLDWTRGAVFTDFLFLLGFQRRGSIVGGPAFRKLLHIEARRRGDVATWRRGDGHDDHPRGGDGVVNQC